MICHKCNNPGYLNTVLGKDFYYCRVCREEIMLEEALKSGQELLKWPDEKDLQMSFIFPPTPGQKMVPSAGKFSCLGLIKFGVHQLHANTDICKYCGANANDIADAKESWIT